MGSGWVGLGRVVGYGMVGGFGLVWFGYGRFGLVWVGADLVDAQS